MFRKLLLPALAATLLAGCVTDYTYRANGGGDYYYGRPTVDYRYYGGYGGGYYGYPGYGAWGYPYRYGAYGYHGYPYYGYPAYPRYPYYRYPYRHGHGYNYNHGGGHRGDYRGSQPNRGGNGPWTGVEDLQRRINQSQRPPSSGAMPMPRNQPTPARTQPPRNMGAPRSEGPREGSSGRSRMPGIQEQER
ncbi:hypothetical protein [Lysobacter panacisoli]|uniref:Lipoprotein n=1 Tax=Lysobacter panacisoli TaxID=1255263 RepID=A0ABP9L1Q0_9GAMM|nr:hypothetical protein [Lysobacter panacisoli]